MLLYHFKLLWKMELVHVVLIYFLGITGFMRKLNSQSSQFCRTAVCQ